jgi:hypothetical protein
MLRGLMTIEFAAPAMRKVIAVGPPLSTRRRGVTAFFLIRLWKRATK